jgi:hypothetical protein
MSAVLNLHKTLPWRETYNPVAVPEEVLVRHCARATVLRYTFSVYLVCIRVYSVGSSENGNIHLGGTCSKTERPSASQ